MNKYDRNKGKPGRKKNLWIRYWVAGEEVYEPSPSPTNDKLTDAHMAELTRQIKAGTWVHPRQRKAHEIMFADYAPQAIEKRIARGVGRNESPPGKSERGHVHNHLVPTFGKYLVREMTFKVIRDGFRDDINRKGLGGKTVTSIHSTLRSIMIEAVEDELIDSPPLPLSVKRDHLPPLEDTRPDGWRDEAIFEIEEVRKLASTDSIATARTIMYLTYFLTGSRFREIVPIKVKDYVRAKKPLHCLVVRSAKHKRQRGADRRRREVPVHPDLKAWLDWWLAEEYEVLFGRKPQSDDLLFPTVSVRRRNKGLETVSHNELYKQWQRNDLPAAGLRHRRLHDARRTLLSALKNAGADPEVRRKITHWSVEDRVLDAYTTMEWRVLCEAMSAIDWSLPRPGVATPETNVVQLRQRS
jgi:integrase